MKEWKEVELNDAAGWKLMAEKPEAVSEHCRKTAELLTEATDGALGFVMIGDGAYYAFLLESCESPEQRTELAEKAMQAVLEQHPDFETIELDDGGVLMLMLDGALWQVVLPEDIDGEWGMVNALMYRAMLMEACEEGKVRGVLLPA